MVFAKRKDTVMVTGCSGFIGSAVMNRLAEDYKVIGLDLKPPEHAASDVHFVKADISSDESVQNVLSEVKKQFGRCIASVVHLAAYFDLSGKPNKKYNEITIDGTRRLLIRLKDFKVEQFMFSSTMLVHKPCSPGNAINENWPMEASHPYPASKIVTERMIRSEHDGIPIVLLRPAGVYDDECHNAFLAHQIARVHERKLISHLYPGDLSTGQPFLHLQDLVAAIVQLIKRRRKLPTELPLLLGEEEVMSVGELQQQIGRQLHGEKWHTMEVPPALAKTGAWLENEVMGEDMFIKGWMVDRADDYYALDIASARELLGWVPRHRLRDTLPHMLQSLKENPAQWYRENKLNPYKMEARSADEEAPPSPDERQAHKEKMKRMHLHTLWTQFAAIMLGLWLASSPFIWDGFSQTQFGEAVVRVTSERGLSDPMLRSLWLAWSDLISGLLICLFGALALFPHFSWAQWANTAIGCWLLFAPLLFWSPSAAVYNNDTLVGALVIAFSILVPMMPGMSHEGMMDESDIPPGWTYSPSSYAQRIPIIGLGLFGFLIARYLAAYQLGHISRVWDPFFGGGTARIITSDVSKAWPVPDAGLGAVSYMFEILMGIMGSAKRWRTMPWMVLGFGFVVVPLGAISIFFIIIQPIVIGTWCSLCLLAAAAMVIMIPFTLDEVVASGQFLLEVYRRKQPFWRNFFKGGAMPGGSVEDAPKHAHQYLDISDMSEGITWQMAICTLIGMGLMCTRLMWGTEPPMADSDHLIGSLVIVFSVSAMAEVGRLLRFINIPFGLWLIAAPWMLSGATVLAAWSSVAAGVALILLSLPRGRRSKRHYGSWDRFIV